MIEEIKIGDKNVLFARHNGKLIYPKYASTENLVLHYDFSGRTNLDVQKGIAEDLSGKGSNGVLQNFAYTNESGYLDNALIFDGIDDFITIPKPLIDLNNFTYSEGINVLSFRGDNVATVVDGVVEIGGRNLIVQNRLQNGYISTIDGVSTASGPDKHDPNYYLIPPSKNFMTATVYSHLLVPTGGKGHIFFYDENKAYLGRTLGSSPWGYGGASGTTSIGSTTITFPPTAFYYRISIIHQDLVCKVEFSNKATDWTPAPEDLETTTFKPLFDKKIKSALYWNRALTDEELLQVYNTQIKRT